MSGSGGSYILIVDDDEGVLTFMATVLRLEGHRVMAATSALQAIEFANRWSDAPIGLLITDIVMPEMDGYALAAQLTASHESLPILYVSGFTEKETGARNIVAAAAPLLHKPFSADELRAVVGKILSPTLNG